MKALSSTPAPAPTSGEGDTSVHKGDHVYFRNRKGKHLSGEVRAVGKDGFVAKSDLGDHRVPWDSYVGHKSRRKREVSIVDDGEDGALARLDDGQVIFLARQPPKTAAGSKGATPVLFKSMAVCESAPDVEDRECWPSGYMKPKAGDRVFQMLAGFARPVVVSAKVYATEAGKLRVKITRLSGPVESDVAVGATLPLTEQWRCYGDPRVQSEMNSRCTSERAARGADDRAAFAAATQQAVMRARALHGHRPIDPAALSPGDRIFSWEGGNRAEYVVADVSDSCLNLYEVGAPERYAGEGKRRRRLCDLTVYLWSPDDWQEAVERFTAEPVEMGKSMLFLKAEEPKAGRPGLTQEERTDKTGKTVKRWVLAGGKPAPAAKAPKAADAEPGGGRIRGAHEAQVGQHITYPKEGAKKPAHGKVIAKGKDGVTVEGVGGERQTLTWDQVKGGHLHDPGVYGKSTMSDEDISKLDSHAAPTNKSVRQRGVKDEASAYSSAEQGMQEFKEAISGKGGLADALGAEVFDNDAKAMNQYIEEHPDKAAIVIAPLKGRDRASEKASTEGWDNVKDLVRGSIVVPSLDKVPDALKAVKSAGIEVIRLKNRFHKDVGGYRDILMNVRLPGGHVAELQVHAAPMLQAKEKFGGHAHYEVSRRHAEAAERGEALDADAKAAKDHADRHMAELYGQTWAGMRGVLK